MPAESIRRALRRSTAAVTAAVLCVVLGATTAGAQTAPAATEDIPSVGVTPTESKPGDPNEGQWFVFNLEPGKSASTRAKVTNPAKVAQMVRLYVRDLTFGSDGTPAVNDAPTQTDVGTWGRFAQPSISIPAGTTMLLPFTVAVPAAAEPGDHVGVVVVESAPQGGDIKIVRRVATRLYVTVPGEATKAFSIIKVERAIDSTWFPGQLDVVATLRNTGRVRLHPVVRAGSAPAKGAETLLARSVEPYTAEVKVPWYGGPVKAHVVAVAEGGLTRTVAVSLFVVPWGLIIGSLVALIAGRLVVATWRRRLGRIRGLQQDVRRLEQLVAHRPGAPSADDAPVTARPSSRPKSKDLSGAAKRARRSKSATALQAVALAAHRETGDALDLLRESLALDGGTHRDGVEDAIASYDRPARKPRARSRAKESV